MKFWFIIYELYLFLKKIVSFSSERRKEKMLAIFNKGLVNPPQELHSPASLSSSREAKHPQEIFKEFLISQPSNAFSFNFGNAAALAYVPPENPYSVSQRYPLHYITVRYMISCNKHFSYLSCLSLNVKTI